jgi:hypothetical protein
MLQNLLVALGKGDCPSEPLRGAMRRLSFERKEKTLWLADASAFAVFTSVLIRNPPLVSQSATGAKILSCRATGEWKSPRKPDPRGR